MDNNNTFISLFPALGIAPGVAKELTFMYRDTITHVEIALSIRSSDIAGDYMMNSKNKAVDIYQEEEKTTRPISQTSMSTQPTSDSNPLGWIGSLPITWVGYIIGALALFFGGLREVVKLAKKEEREKLIDEIKQLLHLFRLYRPKKMNEIKNEPRNAEKPNQYSQSGQVNEVEKEPRKNQKHN